MNLDPGGMLREYFWFVRERGRSSGWEDMQELDILSARSSRGNFELARYCSPG